LCKKVSPNAALEYASKYGRLEVVRWLLTVANPYYRESLALRNALKEGHIHVVELLMPLSNCITAREVMKLENEYDPQQYSQLEEFIQRQQLRAHLHQATHESGKEAPQLKRKM